MASSALHNLCVCDGVPLRTSWTANAAPGRGRVRVSVVRNERLLRIQSSVGPWRRIRASAEERREKKRRIASLRVEKLQSVPLPTFADGVGRALHLSAFLREPEGRQCMLNSRALRKYESAGDGVFKCYLPTVEFLTFEVAPVLDLAVDATEDGCRVELLACKFEGSDLIRSQNERFAASMKNRLSWEHDELRVRLELDVSLEVYTLPFAVLPISAVEAPGTLILQALVDRLLPLFVEQLLTDYRAWAEARLAEDQGDGRIVAIEDGDRETLNVGSIH